MRCGILDPARMHVQDHHLRQQAPLLRHVAGVPGPGPGGRPDHPLEGLDRLLAEYGDHVSAIDLLPVGAPRRDWRATLIADGMVIVRNPDLDQALEMARRFAAELYLFAG